MIDKEIYIEMIKYLKAWMKYIFFKYNYSLGTEKKLERFGNENEKPIR